MWLLKTFRSFENLDVCSYGQLLSLFSFQSLYWIIDMDEKNGFICFTERNKIEGRFMEEV